MTKSSEDLLAQRIAETTQQIEDEREEKRAARAARLKYKAQAQKTAKIERLAGLFILILTILMGIAIQLVYGS